MKHISALLLIALAFCACSGDQAGARCESNSNCAANQFCSAGKCASGGLVQTLLEGSVAHRLAFAPEADLLAAGGNPVVLWDTSTWEQQLGIPITSSLPMALAFSPDGSLLAGAVDAEISLWSSATGDAVRTFDGHPEGVPDGFPEGGVANLAFAPDGSKLASAGGNDNSARVWRVSDGAQLMAVQGFPNTTDPNSGYPPPSCTRVAFSPDATAVLALVNDAPNSKFALKAWSLADGQERLSIQEGTTPITRLAVAGEFVAANVGRAIKLWKLEDGSEVREIGGDAHQDDILTLGFTRDGRLLASGTSDGEGNIRIWRVEDGELLATFETGDGVKQLAFSRAGRFIASASYGSKGVLVHDIAALQ